MTEYQASLLVRGHADGFFLNEYKILDRLGKGRMAGVYKAQHRLGQIFAVKVLPPSRAADPNFLGRFQREAKLAMRLKHPNIVRAFQVGQAGGLHYLVMEYLEGETLEDVLARRKKLPPAEAVRLVFQALQGLQHIHSQGLIHRDLKPANLMLVRRRRRQHRPALRSSCWTSAWGGYCSRKPAPRQRTQRPDRRRRACWARRITCRPEQARDPRAPTSAATSTASAASSITRWPVSRRSPTPTSSAR